MSLVARIENDFLVAYKAKKTEEVAVLRMLKAAVKNRQIELLRDLTDNEILDVLIKQVKQRQESIEQFRTAKRNDLADKEERECQILQAYLPKALSAEETERVVQETINHLGASGMKDMGRVMNSLLGEYAGQVDGKALSALVRAKLAQ